MLTVNLLIEIVTALCGTLGFGIVFNMRGKRLLLASLGGMFAWLLYLLLENLLHNEVLCYFIVSLVAAVYAEVMARVLKTPAITFCIISLIPLIPGSALYYSIASVLAGDSQGFFGKAAHTLSLAAALSMGMILVAAFSKTLKFRNKKK